MPTIKLERDLPADTPSRLQVVFGYNSGFTERWSVDAVHQVENCSVITVDSRGVDISGRTDVCFRRLVAYYSATPKQVVSISSVSP